MKARIAEIFDSIDGEVNHFGQGMLTTFVRFQGCNLDCSYCDTPHSRDFQGGQEMDTTEIIKFIKMSNVGKVTITGGEPLLQSAAVMEILHGTRKPITIETNGTQSAPSWASRLFYVVDWKLDNEKLMNTRLFSKLCESDWVKIPITSRQDFEEAQLVFRAIHKWGGVARTALSPVGISPIELLGWIQGVRWPNGVPVLNIQLHKIIRVR